jgi:nucleoside-diphosphate-sugar epimerase
MDTVLLTGATGFLGSHLLEALLKAGYQVVILKRTTSDCWRIRHLLDQVTAYDVDREPIARVFEENRIDYICHLATYYKKNDAEVDYDTLIESNVVYPMKLVALAIQHQVKGFINTGTFFEYADSNAPLTESSPLTPKNFYARSKNAFIAALENFTPKLPCITLRLFSPYGEKDNHKLIPLLIKNGLKGQATPLSDCKQRLDFVYAGDIANAYIKAIENLKKQDGLHKIYNIGTGITTSIHELVETIELLLGKPVKITEPPYSAAEYYVAYASIQKAKEKLDWLPQVSLKEGLNKTISYYQNCVEK